ncbi:MAG: hypothetical protein IV088_07275 [Hydrogenophaga sp.]|uniref:hypothetical protein n=1 Tax=Hydrogenophaga sp. TaxID=1904254 RepID=UPI0025C3CA1D|nr:hypothetical protein [Hydrogenophaga sp.]MBT9550630.1 hypothetical protein [Hydrogenophaga sp.]
MKTLLVAMSRPDTVYGTHPAHFAVLSGRQVLQHGQGVADELRGLPGRALRLSLDSAANLTERLRVRALSRRFVPVLVQRQLAENGAFTDRFRFRSRMLSLRQGEAEVDVCAMLEDDAELAQDLLPSQERPLTHLLTAEASVAAFVGAAADGPVLVHWWHDGGLRTLGVRDGRVVWQRVQPFPASRPDTASDQWKTLLDAASASAPTEFAGAHGHTIRLGPGPWAASGDWATNGSRELITRLGALFKGVPPEQPLSHPDLYGLAFADRQQSLIVNGYRQRVLAWQWAPALGALASVAGAACLGLGIWWHAQADQQMAALQLELTTLSAQAEGLQQQRPPAEAVAALRSAAWRETALGANLRADHFLKALLAEVPEGAQVLKLSIQRNDLAEARVKVKDGQPLNVARKGNKGPKAGDVQSAQAATAQTPSQPVSEPVMFTPAVPVRRMPGNGEPSFRVDLNIALGGGYEAAKLKSEALAEQLSKLGRLSNTRMSFQDTGAKAPGARLQTQLTIAAGAF